MLSVLYLQTIKPYSTPLLIKQEPWQRDFVFIIALRGVISKSEIDFLNTSKTCFIMRLVQ